MTEHPLDGSLAQVSGALRRREVSVRELVDEAILRHERSCDALKAYKVFDEEGARAAAAESDERLEELQRSRDEIPPLLGIPVSIKDLYGVTGLPTFAGTPRQLPARWSKDGWLVSRIRRQGAVFVGKTHTVELALGGVGLNPHWDTPRNPWDAAVARVPGGSSSGAGVSLWEGSALVALGSDTGGSIRIPASMTGTVGLRTTKGRWPTDGVVPLSPTLDTVGALTRTVEDALYVFAAVDPDGGDPPTGPEEAWGGAPARPRVGVPRCDVWDDCQADIAEVLEGALDELAGAGWSMVDRAGSLLDEAGRLYLGGAIPGAECQAMLERDLPGWRELLHPIVGSRLAGAPSLGSSTYASAIARMQELAAGADTLFDGCDVLALPTTVITPPSIESVQDLDRYVVANRAALWPTSPASILGFCALTLPVGLDGARMPVGLQLVARPGNEHGLLGVALAAERTLGFPRQRLGRPPLVGPP